VLAALAVGAIIAQGVAMQRVMAERLWSEAEVRFGRGDLAGAAVAFG
jgi:hypothetical protein